MNEDEYEQFFNVQAGWNIGDNLRETEFVPTYNDNFDYDEEEVNMKVYNV